MDRSEIDGEYKSYCDTLQPEVLEWINEYYGDRAKECLEGMYDFPGTFRKTIMSKYKKHSKNVKVSYIYLTLSPDKFLRNMDVNDSNIAALKDWCERWFHHNPNYYNGVSWVVENGSQGDHLHVHAVCDMKTSHKHAERLKRSWARTFPNNQLILSGNKTGNEYHSMRFDDPIILKDKLDYFDNEKKGSHENLFDLGVRGSCGVLTDNS